MKVYLSQTADGYRMFLRVKRLPSYRIVGHVAEFPDEYAHRLGVDEIGTDAADYKPKDFLFDYQSAIARMAIDKRRFSVFADCGLGKSLILLEFARHVRQFGPVLIVSPLMVVPQTMAEAKRFYGDLLPVQHVKAAKLADWLRTGEGVAITNYDALEMGLPNGRLAGLILDESSMLKSMYGKWGQACLELGAGREYKLALTGTPAPNDRIEYANHAVFMDAFPTQNAFLAKFFVNRGQTDNRWELKPHALEPFYRALSHWCIFLTNPATYGWKDNCENVPPIHVHIHDVDLTDAQNEIVTDSTGSLFGFDSIGGIGSRSVMSQIAKGSHRGEDVETNKPEFIRNLVNSWPDESTLIWCWYNREQEILEKTFPEAASIKGETPLSERLDLIEDFKAGRRKVLISKGKILGFGLNLQIATRQIFSGIQDSYETFYQCVKRSNRIGSLRPLNVHIPVTDIERPMLSTVLEKAKRVEADAREQEAIFRSALNG